MLAYGGNENEQSQAGTLQKQRAAEACALADVRSVATVWAPTTTAPPASGAPAAAVEADADKDAAGAAPALPTTTALDALSIDGGESSVASDRAHTKARGEIVLLLKIVSLTGAGGGYGSI
jgi:hypothetical protein